MSNKRIQKKRAKAELMRDKSRLIANLVVCISPHVSRDEHLRMCKELWKLDTAGLFRVIDRVMEYQLRATPLRKMLRVQ